MYKEEILREADRLFSNISNTQGIRVFLYWLYLEFTSDGGREKYETKKSRKNLINDFIASDICNTCFTIEPAKKKKFASPFSKTLKAIEKNIRKVKLGELTDANFQKILESSATAKKKTANYTLERTPSQLIKDIIWALTNSKERVPLYHGKGGLQNTITDKPEKWAIDPNSKKKLKDRIETLKKIIALSKGTSLRNIHRNLDAIDFLLSLDKSTSQPMHSFSGDNFPPLLRTQLKKIQSLGGFSTGNELTPPEEPEPAPSNPSESRDQTAAISSQNTSTGPSLTVHLNKCFELAKLSRPPTFNEFIDCSIHHLNELCQRIEGPEDQFMQTCMFEAFNDLVLGKLHLLDPVNGDASCQFRVPFILDLQSALREVLNTEASNKAVQNYLTYVHKKKEISTRNYMATSNHQTKTQSISLNWNGVAKMDIDAEVMKKNDFSCPDITQIEGYEDFLSKVIAATNELQLSQMSGFPTKTDCPLNRIFAQTGDVPASYLNGKFERNFLHQPNAIRYLTLCKALTVKSLTYYDEFYIMFKSGAVDFPGFTEGDMKEAYVELAWYSTAYIKAIFNEMVLTTSKEIQTKLNTNVALDQNRIAHYLNLGLQETEWYYVPKTAAGNVIAYYENKRLMYMYLFLKKIPFIIDLRRLIARNSENPDDFTYQYSGGGVYYFIPDENLNRYVHVPAEKLSDEQKKTPGLCIDCYSMMVANDKNTPPMDDEDEPSVSSKPTPKQTANHLPDFAFEENYEKFEKAWLEQTDLIDQILITTMSHGAATGSTQRRADDTSRYLRTPEKQRSHFCQLNPKQSVKRADGSERDEKLGDEDVLSLYGLLQYGRSDTTAEDTDRRPATSRFMTTATAAVEKLGAPLFLTTDKRDPLPLFGNRYYDKPWDMFKERAFIHNLSQRVDYNGYVYQRNGTQDDKIVKVRSAVTYILSCRHLYPGLYEERVRHAANFKSEYKLSTKTISDTRFSAVGSGVLNLSFID